MKYATSVALVFILVLAGAAVWAQCPGSCAEPVKVQCPAACPEPVAQCPQPCPQPCPQACCPATIPAAVGAGPAGELAGLQCPDFDPAYTKRVFEQNATIIAVAEFGMQRASNSNLRDISGDIRSRLMGANAKLAGVFAACGCLTADNTRAQAIIAELCSQSGECFDVAYAKTLSALVKQSQCADELGGARAVNPVLRQQAQFMARNESNWAFRLDRWTTDHGYTP